VSVWELHIQEDVLRDRLVEAAISDLKELGNELSIRFIVSSKSSRNVNVIEAKLCQGLPEETVQITSSRLKSDLKRIVLKASDPTGIAYGLYYIWDRMRIYRTIPLINEVRRPAFKYRFTYIPLTLQGSLKSAMLNLRRAIRVGINHVFILRTEDFIPWNGEHDEKYMRFRELLKRFIDTAHKLHVKVLVYGDEFIYTDSWLKKFGAKLCCSDPALWIALKEKYRALLKGIPELDGVAIRIGEVIPHASFKAFDIIHSRCAGENESLEYRYRKFLETIYEVVVEEFGKLYYHRMWVTNDWEQHSVPEILQRILDGFPKKNFLISIKLTETDQWEYQPLNPTIGAVKHTTIVECETGRAHQWGGPVMDFAAEFIQAGLQYALMKGAKGVLSSLPSWSADPKQPGYDALSYVVWRLVWNPNEDLVKIVSEWARQYFDEAAPIVAEILLRTDDAIRSSYYIAPYATRVWNPLGHIYGNMFVCKGHPLFDNGRGHDEFLREVYLHCKPCLDEVWEFMDKGVALYDEFIERYTAVKNLVLNARYREEFEKILRHARAVLNLNRLYVKAFTSYFKYRESKESYWQQILTKLLAELEGAVSNYEREWGFYKLYGIKVFLKLARMAIVNLDELEQLLATSPTTEEVHSIIKRRMEYEEVEANKPTAKKVLYWEGIVDGRDILHIRERNIRIEHLLAEHIHDIKYEFYEPIPSAPARYVIKRIRCRGTALVLENPSEENDYTLKIYLDDLQPGPDKYIIEVYRISQLSGVGVYGAKNFK